MMYTCPKYPLIELGISMGSILMIPDERSPERLIVE
jgi:hypothetical protein